MDPRCLYSRSSTTVVVGIRIYSRKVDRHILITSTFNSRYSSSNSILEGHIQRKGVRTHPQAGVTMPGIPKAISVKKSCISSINISSNSTNNSKRAATAGNKEFRLIMF